MEDQTSDAKSEDEVKDKDRQRAPLTAEEVAACAWCVASSTRVDINPETFRRLLHTLALRTAEANYERARADSRERFPPTDEGREANAVAIDKWLDAARALRALGGAPR